MTNEEYLKQLYCDIEVDLNDRESCKQWKERENREAHQTPPVFSFLMCTYNDVSLLNSAVNSLLRQDFKEWELLILDNSDKTDQAWNMIQNAMEMDDRIKGWRSEENVGWPKGASVLLPYASGAYMSFLAADDCLNLGVLKRMNEVLAEENPDVLWVGYASVSYLDKNQLIFHGAAKPEYRLYEKENRSGAVVDIMKHVYYNSFFHYMKVEFLRENNIDFYSPYYGDCMGMTQAMIQAERMVVLDEIVYFLTDNTSQTRGKYTWDSYEFIFAQQWKAVRKLFEQEGVADKEMEEYVAFRILNNLLANMENLCAGRIRDRYMNPMDKSWKEIMEQMDQMLGNEEIVELFVRTKKHNSFGMLLKKLSGLAGQCKECGIDTTGLEIHHLLQLSAISEEADLEERLTAIMSFILDERNVFCLGYNYFVRMMDLCSDEVIVKHQRMIENVLEKFECFLTSSRYK